MQWRRHELRTGGWVESVFRRDPAKEICFPDYLLMSWVDAQSWIAFWDFLLR